MSKQKIGETEELEIVMIPLTQGRVAVVDKEDGYLADSTWQVTLSSDGRRAYASRSIRATGNDGNRSISTTLKMHRLITAAMGIDPRFRIRHKDGDCLNNRRNNLEVIHSTEVDLPVSFEKYVLSDRLSKVMNKSEILECVQGIVADGKVPTAELMATRLGFNCYSRRPSLGVARETLCFTELKDIFMMLPDELLGSQAEIKVSDDSEHG